jgi:hypothetical protein
MELSKPIAEFDTVKTWGEGLRKQWGGDTIVAKLFRIRKDDGQRVLSVKWRRHYADKVKEFRAQGGDNRQRRGADVLSFMIHNGVLIQG